MAQAGMSWKLVPEGVSGKPAEFTSANSGFMWRVKKDQVEVATGVTWTDSEWGPRTLQLREYPLRELLAIFVDDRPFHSGSLNWHAKCSIKSRLIQCDDSDGQDPRMDRRGKMVEFNFAACMWIYTKVLTEWRKPTPEMQENLKRRMLSVML